MMPCPDLAPFPDNEPEHAPETNTSNMMPLFFRGKKRCYGNPKIL